MSLTLSAEAWKDMNETVETVYDLVVERIKIEITGIDDIEAGVVFDSIASSRDCDWVHWERHPSAYTTMELASLCLIARAVARQYASQQA